MVASTSSAPPFAKSADGGLCVGLVNAWRRCFKGDDDAVGAAKARAVQANNRRVQLSSRRMAARSGELL